ncbi:MAG: RagB/SusD family nutrient uptake outer membrane protein [Bacteroidota bacterium]
MKKYSLILLLVLSAVGCKKSVLELAPISQASANTFYKTSGDMVIAVNAGYAALQNQAAAGTEFMFGDLPTDDAIAVPSLYGQGHGDFDNYTSKSLGTNANNINARYQAAYIGITRVNVILNRIDGVTFTDAALKKRLVAESKFLRAYFYFNLVKVFGGVPLILKELATPDEAFTYGRTTAAAVYAQIQQDFTEAAADLPASYAGTDIGRATSGAAKGMLARVLLFQKKYTEALPLLQAVIAQSPAVYDLLPNYADVFKNANGNNKEILFAVQFTASTIANGEGNSVVGSFNPTVVIPGVVAFTGTNADQPTADLYNAYSSGDARRDINIQYVTIAGVPTPWVSKYNTPSIAVGPENGTDYPVLRYADILLMYAECLNETGSTPAALPYINKVIDRAYGNTSHELQMTNPLITSTYIANQAALRDRIVLERRLELAFEGLRFFDLVRTDLLVPVMNAYFITNHILVSGAVITISNNNKLFPIPQGQIDINPTKITQNPGY